METVDLDLTVVPMIRRLDTILGAWKKLPKGDALRITNDKEPKPLQVPVQPHGGGTARVDVREGGARRLGRADQEDVSLPCGDRFSGPRTGGC